MEIIDVRNLTFKYSNGTEPVINKISFTVSEGDFVVLCGETGSGKSTLLRLLKKELNPNGERTGEIYLDGKRILTDEDDKKEIDPVRIGFVMQNPKEQTVTDKVWHELAFGLENMGLNREVMAAKVAETAGYFGIEDWYEKNVNELSGGQLQLLNLASVMVMNPDILILDEPSAQLDPVSASEFFATVQKLNMDFALTVIIAEHRLEELVPMCNRLMVMEHGEIKAYGKPKEVIGNIEKNDEVFDSLPAAYRLYSELGEKSNPDILPLTVREGRMLVKQYTGFSEKTEVNSFQAKLPEKKAKREPALELDNVFFRFKRETPDVLKNLSLKVYSGEIFCILGGNGSGKTTALNVSAGLLKPYSGSVKIFGKKIKEYKNGSLYNKCLSMLPQDVQTVFLYNTVKEEIENMKGSGKLEGFPYDIGKLADKHPYDLSGGEQQIAALAKAYVTEPKILLLDEPTKGLDAYRKREFSEMLKKLKEQGITCIVVTHDVELAAIIADRCAMFFRGEAVSVGEPHDFFSGNNYYTTLAVRLSRGICVPEITVKELAEKIRK
ncbi:MAG: energy-coupling factor ABC transporter ATP-binding protein [Lachnospiraceae bacterium]|nr:energy-coupling factor ABC transporter ATP-binding protein [Lachnospiraceae bacterium]